MKISFFATASLIALSAFALTPSAFAQASLAGDWQGTLDANGTTFHLVWHVTAAADGTLTSTFDNIDESIYGIKAKTTAVKGSDVTVEVDDTVQANGQHMKVSGSLVGKLNSDGTEMAGTFTQIEPQAQPTANVLFKHASAQAPAPATTPPAIAGDWAGTLKRRTSPAPARAPSLRKPRMVPSPQPSTVSIKAQMVFPSTAITFKDGKLNLDVQAVQGTYDGTVNKDASEIDGTWSQGSPMELNFKRAPAATEAVSKPAAPSDIDGTWQGTLDTPRGARCASSSKL